MIIQPIYELKGKINASPSKSYSHRALLLSLKAQTPSYLINPLLEGDVGISLKLCETLGAEFTEISEEEYKNENKNGQSVLSDDKIYRLTPPKNLKEISEKIDIGNSGTSVRLFTALASLIKTKTTFSGEFFKRNRPITELLDALKQIGVSSDFDENNKDVTITPNNPEAGTINIPGDISSQYITALLCLAPNLKSGENETKINLTSPAKSFPYLKITEDILNSYNIEYISKFDEKKEGYYSVPANQTYDGITYRIPGDFSSAAFIIVAAALNPMPYQVKLRNLDLNSPQGDKRIIQILQSIGADITINTEKNKIYIMGGKFLDGFEYDCSQTPDLFPILCVLGLFCQDHVKIYNAKHVRIKETDRIKIMVRELSNMGAVIEEFEDGVSIKGPQQIKGRKIDHENDHRIAMALTIAALYARSNSELSLPEIVKDSYPNFFSDLRTIGCEFD